MTEKDLLDPVLRRLTERMIPIEVELWSCANRRVPEAILHDDADKIIVRPDLPRAIKLNPTQERAHPLYKPREIIQWAKSL